jgi:ABC-type phosphate transport system permease subunit
MSTRDNQRHRERPTKEQTQTKARPELAPTQKEQSDEEKQKEKENFSLTVLAASVAFFTVTAFYFFQLRDSYVTNSLVLHSILTDLDGSKANNDTLVTQLYVRATYELYQGYLASVGALLSFVAILVKKQSFKIHDFDITYRAVLVFIITLCLSALILLIVFFRYLVPFPQVSS